MNSKMKILDPDRLLSKATICQRLELSKRATDADTRLHKLLIEYGMFDMNIFSAKSEKHRATWRMHIKDFNVFLEALRFGKIRLSAEIDVALPEGNHDRDGFFTSS